jgi:hypothetical protein
MLSAYPVEQTLDHHSESDYADDENSGDTSNDSSDN